MGRKRDDLQAFEQRLLGELLMLHAERSPGSDGAHAPPQRRRPFPRVALVALVSVLGLGGVAVAYSGLWSPALGGRDRGVPSVSRHAVPTEQLRTFAALRRPQRPADRGPSVRRVLRLLTPGVVDQVRVGSIRALHEDSQVTVILLTAARYNRRPARETAGRDGICLLLTTARSRVPFECLSTMQARQIRPPATLGDIAYGLVPDGVSAVRLSYSRGRSRDTRVRSNFFIAPKHRASGDITRIRWLAADGRSLGSRRV